MLTLRPEQMEKFSEAAVKRFENRIVEHLNKFFPSRCNVVGEPRLRKMIRYGIKRAECYGIVGRRSVCNYIDIMLFFGSDFDRDPALKWPEEILSNGSISVGAKVSQLYRAAMQHQSGASSSDE